MEPTNDFVKRILNQAEPNAKTPQKGETIYYYYKYSNPEEIIDSIWEPDPPDEIMVGNKGFIANMGDFLISMKVGEHARFEFYSDEYKEEQTLEMKIVDSKTKPPERWDLTSQERMQRGRELKGMADAILKLGDIQVNAYRYLMGVICFDIATVLKIESSFGGNIQDSIKS